MNSYTQHIKKSQTTKQQVLSLLRWSEMDYAQYQYDQGVAFLKAYIPGDTWGISMLEKNRIYWAWWRNQWDIRDGRFLRYVNRGSTQEGREDYYRVLHRTNSLVNAIYPNKYVIDSSYAQMIGELHNEKETL